MTADTKHKSYLSLTPVDISLTAGTNIPAPLDSPPDSPAYFARPPTAGGGPLSSHPTTPEHPRGAFPPTPEPETEDKGLAKMSTSTSTTSNAAGDNSFRTPASPASSNQNGHITNSHTHHQQTKAPRKLFSLNNLRQSFSSSRTSLNTRPSTDTRQPAPQQQQQQHSTKRPSSPSTSFSTTATTASTTPQPRPRPSTARTKSGSWFRRKSGLFALNGETHALEAVSEDSRATRPTTRDSAKRVKEMHEPAPLLPEIGTLGNGSMSAGEIGWDEAFFKR